MNREFVGKTTLLCLVILISAVFLTMIRSFLMAIFMAGLFSAMIRPVYMKLAQKMNGRKNLASVITVLGIILLILTPLTVLITIIVTQAINVGQSVTPWVQTFIEEPTSASVLLEKIPFYDQILPYRDIIIQKAGELVGTVSTFLINSLSSFTKLTIDAIFSTVIMLYVMFYFLTMGDVLLQKILLFLPLDDHNERRLLHRFTSVTRATIKGSLIIGIMQGTICGLAFAFAGIQGPVFWGSLMAVMSIIPAFGTAIVWFPALLILALSGNLTGVLILAVLCGLVAGNIDNLVRPRLVGKDTEMHDLFVLFGTLGGISMFGLLGIIIGPIVTALFITIWEIYGVAFRDYLPDVEVVLCPPSAKDQEKTPPEE
ncbi:MAG: AI-2E family transporter [Desulforhopalus sp.]